MTGSRVLSQVCLSPAFRRRRLCTALALGAVAGVVLILSAAPDEAQSLLLGLGTGSLVAAIALGVVLTYRGAGVVSFAHGAVATYSAYAFSALRRDGSLFLPFVPSGYGFGRPLPLAPALVIALALAVVAGGAFHFLIFRWLRAAPPLTKAIASVGLLLLLQALVVLRFGSATLQVLPLLASTGIHLGSSRFEVRAWR